MATIQQGSMALIFGAPDADITINGHSVPKESASGIILTDVTFTPTAEEVRTADESGNTVNITTFNPGAEVALSMKPRGTTVANALVAGGYFPKPGDVMIVVDPASVSTFIDHDFSAVSPGRSYRIKTATKPEAPAQMVVWNLTIERFNSIASMTPLT